MDRDQHLIYEAYLTKGQLASKVFGWLTPSMTRVNTGPEIPADLDEMIMPTDAIGAPDTKSSVTKVLTNPNPDEAENEWWDYNGDGNIEHDFAGTGVTVYSSTDGYSFAYGPADAVTAALSSILESGSEEYENDRAGYSEIDADGDPS